MSERPRGGEWKSRRTKRGRWSVWNHRLELPYAWLTLSLRESGGDCPPSCPPCIRSDTLWTVVRLWELLVCVTAYLVPAAHDLWRLVGYTTLLTSTGGSCMFLKVMMCKGQCCRTHKFWPSFVLDGVSLRTLLKSRYVDMLLSMVCCIPPESDKVGSHGVDEVCKVQGGPEMLNF